MYLGFGTEQPLEYDRRDIAAQKRLLAERFVGLGWEFPRILKLMEESSDLYFYATHQVRMECWTRERVALVGDAGYCVSPASGQGTTIAIVAGYVLAGELAANRSDLPSGLRSYEQEIGDYVRSNLDLAQKIASDQRANTTQPDDVPDFGQIVQPVFLKNYTRFLAASDLRRF